MKDKVSPPPGSSEHAGSTFKQSRRPGNLGAVINMSLQILHPKDACHQLECGFRFLHYFGCAHSTCEGSPIPSTTSTTLVVQLE